MKEEKFTNNVHQAVQFNGVQICHQVHFNITTEYFDQLGHNVINQINNVHPSIKKITSFLCMNDQHHSYNQSSVRMVSSISYNSNDTTVRSLF